MIIKHLNQQVMITKEKEIKLLEELVAGDNYFAEYFKKDLEQMVSNIRNDFPIEHGTLFSMDGENQRQINEHLKAAHRDEVANLKEAHEDDVHTILAASLEFANNFERLEEEAIKWIGRNEVIRMKRGLSIELSSADIDYLISNLK